MADLPTAKRRIIPSACNECRKKRTKCDGRLPCSRCESREGLVCVYEPHLKDTKQVMQAELSRIRGEWHSMDAVLKLLKSHEQPGIILDQLKSGKPLDLIARSGRSDAVSDWSSSSSSTVLASPSGSGVRLQGSDSSPGGNAPLHPRSGEGSEVTGPDPARSILENSQSLPDYEHQERTKFASAGWTVVTSNDSLVDHLLALYFCWEYPTFASLSKEHFMHDFATGTPRWCSSLLVNAILALGARSSDATEARKTPADPRSAGEPFFEEAKRQLGSEEVPSLTTIQALGLMSLRQASCGKDASSFYYARQSLRMALDLDLHRQNPASRVKDSTSFSQAEHDVCKATFWGCFNLEQAWCLCIGRPSQVNPGDIGIDKPEEIDEIEDEDWTPYTDAGMISRDYYQPNNVRSVYRCLSELSEIINLGANRLYPPSHQLDSQMLLSTYHKLLEWYDAIPDKLRLGHNFTPTVLFTHMYYHFACLIFFRPFRDLSINESATSPRSICTEAAQNLFTLVKSYKDLYTLRRVPSFVPYMILTANLAYLVDLTPSADETANESAELAPLSYLEEMCSSHTFAERALDIVDYFSKLWGVKTRENSGIHMLRSRLQGMEKSDHPATEVARSDTFFLPASHSSIDPGSNAPQLMNFSTSGPVRSLFPQQGVQLGGRIGD